MSSEPRPTQSRSHPWMALSAPGVIDEMLAEIGAPSVEALFEQIPADHYRKTPLDLPPALTSEMELKRDLVTRLKKTKAARTISAFWVQVCGSTMCRR
jgi:glycine cleavage system pyridoxal-binding protein P